MGAHRKPKTKPTAFAAVVTAAIVVPTGTAAAASYGAFGSPAKGGASGPSAAGLLAAKANAVKPIPTTTTSAAAATTKPSPPAAPPTTSKPTPAPATTPPSPAPSTTPPKPTKPTTPPPSPRPTTGANTQSGASKSVTLSALEPTGLYGTQQYFNPTSAQWANAKTIVAVTEQRGMPLYAAVVAVATAMQESSLTNLTYSTNYDSLGLFQQRPSMGWGTAAQVTDPTYATNAFLAALVTYAPNYTSQALWVSAQAVQRSGAPTAYAQWEDQAATVVKAIATGTA
jgi:hypothetical protein